MEQYGYAFYYIESNIFCMAILILLLIKQTSTVSRTRMHQAYLAVLVSQILYFLTDILWVLVDSAIIPKTVLTLYLTNIVNYCGSALCGYFLFIYLQQYMGMKSTFTARGRRLAFLPCLLNMIMIGLSPLTKLYFVVDDQPELLDGPLYVLMLAITFSYPIASALYAIHRGRNRREEERSDVYRAVMIFPLFPLVFGVAQAFNWRVPFICYGLTLANLFLYISFTDRLISRDPLTGSNNRNELTRQLANHLKHSDSGRPLYLILLDLDGFKQINDTYGHNEGDRALILFANLLKRICADWPFGGFLARYGGDEFILLAEAEDEAQLGGLLDQIRAELRTSVRQENLPYTLTASVGYTRCRKGQEKAGIRGVIARADGMLYEEKAKRHTRENEKQTAEG